ncbi:hypothetical protein [Mesorhizobium sp. M1227]|uniref:hypothetical protein n=1 Tax=Mesorhizobium sp. M1227 TaxID=2957071 RepID=UPI0033398985
MLLDHIVDRRIDRSLVGDAHFKDLQRMPFSLRSFDELSFDSAISGTSRMVATTERSSLASSNTVSFPKNCNLA